MEVFEINQLSKILTWVICSENGTLFYSYVIIVRFIVRYYCTFQVLMIEETAQICYFEYDQVFIYIFFFGTE